eukprot:CAMPEP_0174339544 /NCGR_PEP_ID=MMETSP0810-20121108/23985_1 /TAXON_ID=73025 ORGANISM="Eutreptiella gymnastica-like, Strain CCMP1594" /NCGR_SAMPLE_ID=MMETSP0810 /ASSEMBLY_ACC=CAM_ASM_000659 /LENGTH=67 /DNA_ID=CAMNT_0015460221 /DNA_START=84 /DNA_END=285 /DNA_ORIENTATION=-
MNPLEEEATFLMSGCTSIIEFFFKLPQIPRPPTKDALGAAGQGAEAVTGGCKSSWRAVSGGYRPAEG